MHIYGIREIILPLLVDSILSGTGSLFDLKTKPKDLRTGNEIEIRVFLEGVSEP